MTYTIHWDWAYIYFLQTRDIILFPLSQLYSNQNEQNEMVFEQISACFSRLCSTKSNSYGRKDKHSSDPLI